MERKQIARELYNIFNKEKSAHSFLEMADFVINYIEESKKEVNEIPFIDEWLDLFPEGVKNAGRPIKSDKAKCTTKMKAFLKKYPYNAEEIIKATKEYLDEREVNNYQFTMLAVNFISHRDKGSALAEKCATNRLEEKSPIIKPINNDWI